MGKNIVFLNTHYSWGGGENWTLLTAEGLKDKGHNVWIAGREKSELLQRAAKSGIKTEVVNLYNTLSTLNPAKIASFTYFLKKNEIEIIFLNLSRDRKFGAITGNLAGLERVIYRRGADRPLKRRFYARFMYGKLLTDIIANSRSTRKNVLKNLQDIIPEEKVELIYNGVKIKDEIKPDFSLREKYEIPTENKILINVGRLSSEKGHDLLLESLFHLNKDNKKWSLFIVGEGEEQENILRAIDKYELNEQVFLTGFVDNVDEYLVQADMMVHSARIEGFGLVLVEAMAVGLPVVAVAASNIPEVVEDGEVGLLAEKENPQDLAAKVLKLMEDEALRQEMADNAREFVENNFSIDRMIAEYEDLLNS